MLELVAGIGYKKKTPFAFRQERVMASCTRWDQGELMVPFAIALELIIPVSF
jgi:hypothetical protein